MIRGVGRGFISGWAGVIMIGLALSAVSLCCCCWCYGLIYKRRRRSSLDDPVSDLTLQHDSPRFLKHLAHRENERRLSQVNTLPPESELLSLYCPAKCSSNTVSYSGGVSPYPPAPRVNGNNLSTHQGRCHVPMIPEPMPMPTSTRTSMLFYDTKYN